MLELMADVRSDGIELVVRQFRPDSFRQTIGAEVLEIWAWEIEMVQYLFQDTHVERGIVCDYDVCLGQAAQQFSGYRGELRCVLNIKPRETVAVLGPVRQEESMPFGWLHQPIGRFGKSAILKDRHTGGAHADCTVIGRFKVDAGDVHVIALVDLALNSKADARTMNYIGFISREDFRERVVLLSGEFPAEGLR